MRYQSVLDLTDINLNKGFAMNHLKTTPILFAIFLFLAFNTSHTWAASTSEDNWQFNLAPFYLWGINIAGDMAVGTDKIPGGSPLSKPVDIPFDDIFDAMEGAFIVHFETMYKNNWGLLIDVDYLDLGNSFTNNQGVDLKVDLEVTLAEVAGLYRITRNDHNFDAVFGFRGYMLDPGVTLSNGPKVVDKSQEWIDPFLGGRWLWNFAEKWSVIARGDIGGFGLGSDLSWQLAGLVEWQPFKYASFLAGYRALDVKYETGSGNDYFKFDATIHGPILGINFKW